MRSRRLDARSRTKKRRGFASPPPSSMSLWSRRISRRRRPAPAPPPMSSTLGSRLRRPTVTGCAARQGRGQAFGGSRRHRVRRLRRGCARRDADAGCGGRSLRLAVAARRSRRRVAPSPAASGLSATLGRHSFDHRLRPRPELRPVIRRRSCCGRRSRRCRRSAVAEPGCRGSGCRVAVAIAPGSCRWPAFCWPVWPKLLAIVELVALVVHVLVATRRAGSAAFWMRHLRLGGRDDAVVVLGVLEIVLRHHPVAGAVCVAGERACIFRRSAEPMPRIFTSGPLLS